MRKMLFALITGLLLSVGMVSGQTLVTPSFVIKITVNCEEGNVVCDDVTYVGTRKSDGASLTLKGKTLNRFNSYDMYGYSFKNGEYTYTLYSRSADFEITKGDKVLTSEHGEWVYDD